ncbi:hypothetical protein [Micromonospora sp. NPDC048830]|uniref:hypothetical protein n=1 Tax=Micromonospora sp. NPDC048830 TaxID=3364257 RepID=UPI00371770C6
MGLVAGLAQRHARIAHRRGVTVAHLQGVADAAGVHPDAGGREPAVVHGELEALGRRAGIISVVHRHVEVDFQVPQLALQILTHRTVDGHVEAVCAQLGDDVVVQLVQAGDVAGGEEFRQPGQVVPHVVWQVGDHLLASGLQQMVGDRHQQRGGLLTVRRLRQVQRLPRLPVAARLDQPPRLVVQVERRIRAGVQHPALLGVDQVGGVPEDIVELGVEAGPPVGRRAERHVDVVAAAQPHRSGIDAVRLAVRTGLENTLGELVGVEVAAGARPTPGAIRRQPGRLGVERAGRVRDEPRAARSQAGAHLHATQRQQVPVLGDHLPVVVEQQLVQHFPFVGRHRDAPPGRVGAQRLLDAVEVRQFRLGIAERERPPVRVGRRRPLLPTRPVGVGCGRAGAGVVAEDPDVPVGLGNTGQQPGGRTGHLARDGTAPGLDHHRHPGRGGRQGIGRQRVRAGAVLSEQDDPPVLPDRPTPVHLEPARGRRAQAQRPRLPG